MQLDYTFRRKPLATTTHGHNDEALQNEAHAGTEAVCVKHRHQKEEKLSSAP